MWDQESRPKNLFTFRSGGWVLALTGLLTIFIIAVVLVPALARHRERPPGDGKDPATYGFDLTTCLVPRDGLVAGQHHRDLIVALVDPPVFAGADVARRNAEQRGKLLVSGDRVIGVTVGGESRAYPLNVVKLHEIVNDRLGEKAIAVTYNPLCDSVVVFDREVDGAELEFGVSGLLHNSNLLMYDRRPPGTGGEGTESLWSQIGRRAVAGPAAEAGRTLEVLPAVLTHWSQWFAAHPETTVIERDPLKASLYKETSYAGYFLSDGLLFPTDPAPPEGSWPAKTRCVVVFADGAHRLYPLPFVAREADAEGRWEDTLGTTALEFRYGLDPEVVTVTADGGPATAVPCLFFAWYAIEPDVEIAGGVEAGAVEADATGAGAEG